MNQPAAQTTVNQQKRHQIVVAILEGTIKIMFLVAFVTAAAASGIIFDGVVDSYQLIVDAVRDLFKFLGLFLPLF